MPTTLERHAAALAQEGAIVLRRARREDGMVIALLQQLADRTLPRGERLVAQVGNEIVAAAHIPSGVTVASPAVAGEPVAELLASRARHLRDIGSVRPTDAPASTGGDELRAP